MKYFLIMNPASNGGKSEKKFKEIFKILDEKNISYDYKATSNPDDAYEFSIEANKNKYDVIVSVGGDGTINRVINGFYDDSGRRISNARFGVIYTGTSPDFCKSYHIPLKTEKAVNALLSGKSKMIQIGKITHCPHFNEDLDGRSLSDYNGPIKVSFFACCANIGIGPALARNANQGIRKAVGDKAGTFISLIKALLNYNPSKFTILLDDKEEIIKSVNNISIGITPFIASGIKVKNDLCCPDRRFYNLAIKNIRFFNWPGIFKKIYSGKKIIDDHHITLKYAKCIRVYGCSKNPELEFDGDPNGFLPCEVETAHDPLEVLIGV